MGEKNGKVSHLLEDGWFFGNTLLSCSNSSKSMIRCNSDPSSSSSNMIKNKEDNLLGSEQDYPSKMSNLFRTPSLPPCWDRDAKYRHKEEEEEEDETRMGDLIRQAMPLPLPLPKPTSNINMPKKRLDRTPSLPTSRIREGNGKNGAGIGRLSRKESSVAQVSKLTRRASIDSSMLLPPKCNTSSKSTKQNMSNSKNRPHPIPETPNFNNGQAKIDKSKSEKSLSELEVEELQGFKDLGFSFDNNNLSPSVKQVLPALQRRASLGSSNNNNQVDDNIIIGNNKVKRPYLSESWEKASYYPLSAPHPTRRSIPSSDDMKAQIKFWARAVALNVHQEC